MRVDFQGRNHEVERRLIQHAQPRLEGLTQYNDRLKEVRVTVSEQRARRTIEITCDLDGSILRSEERDSDVLLAFDQALAKIERQLVRYKDKWRDKKKRRAPHRGVEVAAQGLPAEEPAEPEEEPEEFEELHIVRTKTHTLKPMTPEEAVLQMEMVGHDFYVFLDGAAQRVGVVYKRRDGGYGLIEPEVE